MKVTKHYKLVCTIFSLLFLGGIWAPPLSAHDGYYDQQNQPLKEVLQSFAEHYEVLFSYDVKSVEGVNVHFEFRAGETLESAIQRLLKPTGLGYKTFDQKYFVVYRQNKQGTRSIRKMEKYFKKIQKLEKTADLSLQVKPEEQLDHLRSVVKTSMNMPVLREISGTVTDEDGEPLVGATVRVKDKNVGDLTDSEGRFSFDIPEGTQTLVISYLGYTPKEVPVDGKTTFEIVLEADVTLLDEVVVVGYGTQKKSDITGSVASVKAEDLVAFPALDAIQTLQGRAAGLQISSNNGQPGAGSRIRVRGGTSINASSDPLIVVDGLIGAQLPPPEDIASVEILKDASSTAIYGSRGANGVIVVTTKTGSTGKARVNFSSSYTSQEVINTIDMLDRNQVIDYMTEALGSFTPYSDASGGNFDTDWQDQIFRTGAVQNYNLSLSGGTKKVKYYVSGAVFDQKGIILNSGFKRYSLTSNVDAKISDRLSIGANLLVRHTLTDGVATQESSGGQSSTGVITGALLMFPDRPIRDANGNFLTSGFGIDFDNPFAVATERINESKTDLLQGNTYLDFKILEGLNFKTTFGVIMSNQREGTYFPTTLNRGRDLNGFGQIRDFRGQTLLSESYLTYNKKIGAGNLNLVGGYSFQKIQSESYRTEAANFPTDEFSFYGIGGATSSFNINNSFSESEIVSWYGRVNYSLANKYLFTFTGRADGSSNFAANNKWAFFPSGAFAWRLSEEDFMKNIEVISDAKVRVSYGLTGNQAIGPYQSLSRLIDNLNGVIDGQQVTTVNLGNIGNDALTWETTRQFNIGVNVGLFNGRIDLEADYYHMITDDLLFEVPISTEVGAFRGSVLTNIGEVENQGFEFTLNSRNLVGEFTWSTAFNLSLNRNKILALPGGEDLLYEGAPGSLVLGNIGILREGQPVGAFFGFEYTGVNDGTNPLTFEMDADGNPLAGGETFKDVEGVTEGGELTGSPDGVLDANDQTIIGDPNPDFIWGLNNTFGYKGFDLNIFFQASVGGDIYNLSRLEIDQMTGSSNATTDALNRYTASNTNTDVPIVNPGRGRRSSSRFVEDGSFVRLRNISLGYNLPSSLLNKVKIASARLYISGQNLLTFSDYKGFDPEVNYARSRDGATGNRSQGLDYSSYPITKGYTVGINIGF